MCGKGAGLGIFPSDSLQSQSYDFDEIAHIKSLYGAGRHHKRVFEKIEKVQNGCFPNPSHTILMPLRTHTQEHFRCRMSVQNFINIVWTVFEKFEIFIKRSGEKSTIAK